MSRTRRVFFTSILVIFVALLGVAALIKRNAQRVLQESAAQAAQSSGIPFALSSITPSLGPAGITSFDIHGDFQSFALFEGDWMVCNRSTLFRYDKQGRLIQTWRVGLDLPAFPLTALAVRRGIPQPELWIATNGAGALIWDGRAFRQLAPQSAPLLKVTALLPLPDGRMLLGTPAAGLYVSDTHQLSLFRSELKTAEITALALGVTSEEIWIGTRAQGVWLWRAGALNHFLTELPDPQVLSIFGNGTGVWVGTVNGVAEFVDGQFRRRLADGVLAAALVESAGQLWISTVDEGVLTVDLKAHSLRPSIGIVQNEGKPFHAVALLPGKEGVIALGDSQIRNLPYGSDLLAPDGDGLTNGHITALNVDSQRRLWIGYFDRGLDQLTDQPGATVKHLEDDVLFCVNRIKPDETGDRTFVATANGLALFDRNGTLRRVLRASDGLISNHVTDILPLHTSGTVVATNAGLTFMNGATVSSVYAFQGLVNNHVYTVAQSGTQLVAGTLGGVSLLKNAVVQNSLTTANSHLSQNWITASVAVGDDVFLGTYGSGVIRMDSHSDVQGFADFSRSRVEINANAMVGTSRGIYAGTAGQGLAFLPKGEQRWRFWKTGLPSANVTALAADGGNLYIGTDNGLVRIPERDITL